VSAPRYWETGAEDQSFRFNNYLSRYHWRHVDMMDVVSGYQARARASLASVAGLLGLPGKLGLSGAQVWDAWLAGDLTGIRRYCETDVLNTWLIYLRFERMRGRLTAAREKEECDRVRQLLEESSEPHLLQFLEAWAQSAE
jgi:predicted PolB exonuclease-like 3'-5' exonuclease